MPRYKIAGSYGYVGTDWSDEIEAEDEEAAMEVAQDRAMERVDYWAELIEDDADAPEGGAA